MTDVLVADCAKKAGLHRKKVKMKVKTNKAQSIAVCRVFDFYALDEFGFGICSEYEGGFVSFWRNETRRALCAFWLSSREGGLLLLFTVKLGRT